MNETTAPIPPRTGWRSLRPEGGPLWAILFFAFCAGATRLAMRVFYRTIVHHPERVPKFGPLLIAANHQSYLDPPLVGAHITQRQVNFLARAGLFGFKPFAWLISALNSVPIKEEGASDTGAIKEILRRLELGHAVVIFPEGSRCEDGAMDRFKRGVALLVKKSRCPVVPVAVEGCFDAYPRGGRPHLFGKRIGVAYGEPIAHEELMKDGPDAALLRLAREIDAMRLRLREELRRASGGTCPAPGPGDGATKWIDQ